MPTQPALPPLLEPYVSSLSPSSLTLASSVLGATGNWLVLRFLYAALNHYPSSGSTAIGSDLKKRRKVVLVSFLRDWEFWKTEAKRLVGALFFFFIPPGNRYLSFLYFLMRVKEDAHIIFHNRTLSNVYVYIYIVSVRLKL